ncbi:NUDIX hydrolase [Mycolicibacterium aubagnense]|uniref:NUDIX hydrolase n=1 Tax=Mycolicibacterium aubagnense TaxID=319707 RepID=A0ABM7I9H4_9MYCO|nr:NUDIX hydrolase [Mycolicibacterium aubagnense]TLH60110.1 NUDIX hydrolase [Mycolicibacterium aubagnense]WGI34834.1 NUDIX hydrolase [Mycolicibacterium aubagnense]BBX83267.1 NUDIX hydrolase [Mycolicibacterium aubagnense]
MTEADPLHPKPAATVMLVRDGAPGIEVFLMRRTMSMAFAGGMTVFPGGGVDERDYDLFVASGDGDADIAWTGPDRTWWAEKFGVDPVLAGALVCAAARETFEESGVLFAGPAGDPDGIVSDATVYHESRAALESRELSFGEFLARENLVLRADLLWPWANWITPKEERTRRYDTFFFVGALPAGQRADGNNTESDHVAWRTPAAALTEFEQGHSFLLPPTWTQLSSLDGRTVGELLKDERTIVPIEPVLTMGEGTWDIEFFDAQRYKAARGGRAQ